jgi:two-component system KDP operon response regulator KdpE
LEYYGVKLRRVGARGTFKGLLVEGNRSGAVRVSRTILLIEDEPAIREVVREALVSPGDRWLAAATGREGLALAAANNPDLVVLDLGLPDIDGLEVCRGVRARSRAPIVVLSARHSEDEKVALLDAGADDYVTKPFGPTELRARVRAHLRRASAASAAPGTLSVGRLSIDLERRTIVADGRAVHLTPTEWALLGALVSNGGRTLTHQQLFRAVWGDGTFGHAQQYLRVYITHLRKKLEADPYAPRLIVTEPGVGYRFEPPGTRE